MRRAVKCSASDPCRAYLRGQASLFAALSLAVAAPVARAQLLMGRSGDDSAKAPPPLDPLIPTGGSFDVGRRPSAADEPAACSLRAPACVHRARGVPEATVIAWLSGLERAFDRLTGVLGLPTPLPDDGRGGGPALDLYLVPGASDVRTEVDVWEVPALRDAASAFCVAGADGRGVERASSLCVAEAIALRLDASETPFSRRALASELWYATATPTTADAEALDDYQAHPELATVARERSRYAEGSALFLDFLDGAKGAREPASMSLATFSLASGARSTGDFRLTNEPDTLDVLRTNFGATPTEFARLLGDFTTRRAFVGSRDAEDYFPAFRFSSDFGRVRFEWSVPFSSLPRTLAPARPIDPTGTTYLWVSLDGAPPGATLFFGADWEPPVAFKWTLTLVGGNGRVVRTVEVPFLERGTHVERTMTELGGGAGVLVSGINMGGLGPTYPFDPDFEPYEPHSYVVYLAKP